MSHQAENKILKILIEDDVELSGLSADRAKFISTMHNLASSGIGEDPSIQDAFLGFLFNEASHPLPEDENEGDSGLLYIMQQARIERSQQPEFPLRRLHASMVALYAANYIFMHKLGDLNYPRNLQLDTPIQWQKQVWKRINDDPELRDEFARIMYSKELITSHPNRGSDFPFITQRIFGDKALNINDLGSSFGFPWARAICKDCDEFDPYETVDRTTYQGKTQLLLEAAKQPVHAREVVLVDHMDPRDDIPWFIANCYPKQVSPEHVKKTISRINKYTQVPGIEFRKGNMIKPPLEPHQADIVSAIMSGYELPWEWQKTLINSTMPELINKEGIQLVKDYLIKGPTGELIFTNERKPFTQATAVRGGITNNEWLIVTRHSNSRCRETANGEDFETFMELTSHLPHNQ